MENTFTYTHTIECVIDGVPITIVTNNTFDDSLDRKKARELSEAVRDGFIERLRSDPTFVAHVRSVMNG